MIIRFLKVILFCSILIKPVYAAENFVEGMEDVPLAQGLNQISQDNISFGNEETRLLEAYFTAKNTKFESVADFYRESLPQLGWKYQGKREDSLLFDRDGETFELVRETKKPLIVRITVKTKP